MRAYRSVVGFAVLATAIFAAVSSPAVAANQRDTSAFAQVKRRPHVVIHPRYQRLAPNAKRICRFWLAQEYRPSGTVITPQQRCWWEQ